MRWAEFRDMLKRGASRGTCPHQLALLLESGLPRFILFPERLTEWLEDAQLDGRVHISREVLSLVVQRFPLPASD